MRKWLRSVQLVSAIAATVLGWLLAGAASKVSDFGTRGGRERGYRLRCPTCNRRHRKVWPKKPPPDDPAWICRNGHDPVTRKAEPA
jgi:hypothetical protein